MIIHFHHSFIANSGELRRMKNIDKDMAISLSDKTIEVEFYSMRDIFYIYKKGRFVLSDRVIKKFYIPRIPWINFINNLYKVLILVFLSRKYKADYIIGEISMIPFLGGVFRRFVKQCKIVFDIHGASVEETLYTNPEISQKLLDNIRKREKYSLEIADYIICQSDEMKKYLLENYLLDASRICVYRCGVDMKKFNIMPSVRTEIRNFLGVKDHELLFVYAGGLHKWQRIEDSLLLFSKYWERHPDSKFLILTGDTSLLSELLSLSQYEKCRNNIIAKTLPFEKVPSYLNSADIAFLLRHKHTMNSVASPTKLAEYMACGLPIISSDIATKWVNCHGIKYILDENKLETISDIYFSKQLKKEISLFAEKYLSLEVDKKAIENFFKKNESSLDS